MLVENTADNFSSGNKSWAIAGVDAHQANTTVYSTVAWEGKTMARRRYARMNGTRFTRAMRVKRTLYISVGCNAQTQKLAKRYIANAEHQDMKSLYARTLAEGNPPWDSAI